MEKKVEQEHNSKTGMEIDLNKILASRFFRLALFSIPFIISLLGLYFYSKPYTYVVRGEAAIVCENDKIYPAYPNRIESAEALYEFVENGFSNPSIRDDDERARKLCAYGVAKDFIPFRRSPKEINYSVRPGTSSPTATGENSDVTLK